MALFGIMGGPRAFAVVLWSDLGATLIHESGNGDDILGGAVKRDSQAADILYFKFHLEPLSDVGTEEYFASFQLYEGEAERLGVGNSLKAWAYSAFNTDATGEGNKVFGDMDLRSARPESSAPGVFLPYELPRRGIENTIVFKVQFVPDGDDLVTVWLNPDLSAGATEESQSENLVTKFAANASFSQIRLRHGGGGGGWTFSDMAVATSFSDLLRGGESGVVTTAGRGVLQMTFRSWQREQGLSQNAVHALAQTPDGYLWIGSDDGVTRFDGVRFVSFGVREGLRGGQVRVLMTERSGALWIGTAAGGLMRMDKGQFVAFTVLEGLPANSITALLEDNAGRLWVGTESGLALHQGGHIAKLDAAKEFKGRRISALMEDSHGVIWVGVAGVGVFRYQEGRFVPLTDATVEELLRDSHCLLEDKQGRLWLGVGEDLVLCRERNEWRRYRIPRHLAKPYVGTLAEGPDGTVWAGSVSEGLIEFSGGRLAIVNASTGLSDNFVESLLVDREGNLWVGTGGGLNRLRRSRLGVFGQNEGLGHGPVRGLAEMAPGIIWACKPGDGIFRREGRNFSRMAGAEAAWRAPEASSLLVARDGSCWVAGAQGLMNFRDPKATTAQPDQLALAGRSVTALLQDRNGGMWAGTASGELWHANNGEWQRQTNRTLLRPITALAQGRDGYLWIGTDGDGLFRFGEGEAEHFDKRHGLLSDSIRTLQMDAQGVLWIGTAGGGLARWRAGQIKSFTTREGLPDDTISQILEDDLERLWLGSNRGILCVSKRELEELASGKANAIYPQIFGRLEGMPSEECTGGFFPAGLRSQSGRLWFSTMKGIVVADPRTASADLPAPPVVIEEVWVDGVATDAGALEKLTTSTLPVSGASKAGALQGMAAAAEPELKIGPGKRRLEFHFTGLSFSAPERVRFRFRLEGLDADWLDAGSRRSTDYSYVPPGEYRFRVTACNSAGVWNEQGASLKLRVLPRFWEARWFLAGLVLGALGCVAGIVRMVEKRRHQSRVWQLEQERVLERERARIAQDLHDDLGSSLTRLSLLSELLKADKDAPAQVELHAKKISQSAGQTVRALDEIVWALRPGSDTLQSLVEYIAHFANELFEGDRTRCRLDLPHDLPAQSLPPEMRHNIFLIVKEALTNALKHAGATEVCVLAQATSTRLEIEVRDDGRSFDSRKPPVPGKRQGLGNMQSRAAAIGGELTVESSAATGTRIKLVVKFPPPPAGGKA